MREGKMKPRIYIASKTKHAARWRELRDAQGYNITSTWIDEAGPGESKDLSDLARRCVDEARKANALILYCESGDFPLKGALIEVGAALGAGVPVFVVGECESLNTALASHPLWLACDSLEIALKSAAPMCSVCGLEHAIWGNRVLLKSDDRLCLKCFELWYDEGMTNKSEMRRRRLESIQAWPTLNY